MANPLRLREMQERNGIKPKKDKSERKREKEEKKRLKMERKRLRSGAHSRSPSPPEHDYRHSSRRFPSEERYSSRRRTRSPFDRRASPLPPSASRHDDRRRSGRMSPSPSTRRRDSRSRSPPRRRRDSEGDRRPYRESVPTRGRSPSRSRSRSIDYGKRVHSPSRDYESNSYAKRPRLSPPRAPRSVAPPRSQTKADDDRAARLAAMAGNASSMNVERQERLKKLLEKEKADAAAEEAARAKSKGMGGFLSSEQKKVFGGAGGLEDRIRRGRGGMVLDAE